MNKLYINILIFGVLALALVGGWLYYSKNWPAQNQLAQIQDNFDIAQDKDVSLVSLMYHLGGFDGEKNYLLLFQNNIELRPAGGYIGNFGLLKVKNGKIILLETHNTNVFDGYNQIQTEPPLPIKTYLKQDNWALRDSNWSPDFSTSAKQAEYFYFLTGGLNNMSESFDGIIAINAAILPHLMDYTGPITLEEHDITFKSETVLYDLEYEVEKGYVARGFDEGNRKVIFKELFQQIVTKLTTANIWDMPKIKNIMTEQLDQKNILIYLKNSENQQKIEKLGWSGSVKSDYDYDYLMLTEANLGGRKSNFYVQRSINYTVDFDSEKPTATLQINFTHTGTQNDWFNANYLCYLRVYTPAGSWLINAGDFNNQIDFGEEFNKKVFGYWFEVPTNSQKTLTFTYTLPDSVVSDDSYKLLIQKQSGIDQLPIMIKVIKGGKTYAKEAVILKDWQGAIQFEQ